MNLILALIIPLILILFVVGFVWMLVEIDDYFVKVFGFPHDLAPFCIMVFIMYVFIVIHLYNTFTH